MTVNKYVRSLVFFILSVCMLLCLTACGGYSIVVSKDTEQAMEPEIDTASNSVETNKNDLSDGEPEPEPKPEEKPTPEEPPEKEPVVLGVDLEPYESKEFDAPSNFSMDGITYMDGFTMNENWNGGYAIFNLQGQYQYWDFDLGHINTVTKDKEILVYLDGELAQKITLEAEAMVHHVTIPLNGAKQLKLEPIHHGYGFANSVLS